MDLLRSAKLMQLVTTADWYVYYEEHLTPSAASGGTPDFRYQLATGGNYRFDHCLHRSAVRALAVFDRWTQELQKNHESGQRIIRIDAVANMIVAALPSGDILDQI
ncbi:hypothetical protein ACO22_05055 [Paracoccidioides brasiliensis]|uniref:Uncharacterized protein n=1 Tax=Paracoccidioides brasiliensis TaxID=121759 RepID=A0A1D2JBE4_PARBR|nr:hypothetical protein ACO22_05055 [Paracoccidioides brasiliensis]ODH51942.1 hypothetical protein GX48_01955 [Paracoccidioides brasiliensis]